ncbi:MAG: lysylphosphatidylglycerol synthase transmembrane domain-containing protein, partial [Gemmatimonadota bacterium]
VERVFDGIIIVLLLLAALASPGFPAVTGRDFGGAALWLGALFLGVSGVLFAMVVRPHASVRLFERTAARVLPAALRRPIVDALDAFLDGLAVLRDWRLVVRVAAWSLVIWLVASLGTWVGLLAFGIDVPLIAGVFLQSIIALAVALPSAPGFFGVFEAAARVGLVQVWGVASEPAVAFAIGFHLAGFVPVTIMGLYYLWRLGLSWGEMGRSEEVVESAVERGTGTGAGTGPG